MRPRVILTLLLCSFSVLSKAQHKKPIDEVNPFIGTSNYGTTHPGAMLPHGLMSISPFNVMKGDSLNKYEKDSQWWSAVYSAENKYFTGFSQVNLSGVGCPDLGGILLMPQAYDPSFDPAIYGSHLSQEQASPAYYSCYLDKYHCEVELTATTRSSVARFKFKEDSGSIVLNLGEGLTNESGAEVKFLNDSTIVGSKLFGGFCYNNNAAYRLYFVVKLDTKPTHWGIYKKQRVMTAEAKWDRYSGTYKRYPRFREMISGDDLGCYMQYKQKAPLNILVRTAVSTVSVEEALRNLADEQKDKSFESILSDGKKEWEKKLSLVKVYGGDKERRTVFYTSLYHSFIHPTVVNDISGTYRQMESLAVAQLKRNGKRYSVFSLWDTFRTIHPLYCILTPKEQLDMLHSILEMYQENGWLPKWELFSRETYTMDGDPAAIVINDSWQRGLQNFNAELALEAMKKTARYKGKDHPLRPFNFWYDSLGYIPYVKENDNSVSASLEYYLSDANIAVFAKSLGDNDTYRELQRRALKYKMLYSKEFKCFRPKLKDGRFYGHFDPTAGKNFTPNPGFHEGCAWNYAFYVPHEHEGLIKLMGGEEAFVRNLDKVFENKHYDPANEPDIDLAYLYSYIPQCAYKTQELIPKLLKEYFSNTTAGLPGNDDAGTMSAWAVFSMMGMYPVSPGKAIYVLSTPSFEAIDIYLDTAFYKHPKLEIRTKRDSSRSKYIKAIELDGKLIKGRYIFSHQEIFSHKRLRFHLSDTPPSL